MSPIVITVKKNGSVKLALESKELNKQVHKNKYQMPNIEELMDTVEQTIREIKSGDILFTTMDLTYAYGQLPLSAETSVQCNFSLIGGRSTGTYRFKTGFYGLTTMPAEFQRAMDCILAEYPQAQAFIGDILVVSRGTAIDHIATVEKILKKTGSGKYVSKTIKMQSRTTGLRVARPQNNIDWNNSPGTENRTDRSINAAANFDSTQVVHGVNT